jgi:nucleoside-specific outer membrane channel protein Tsx
MFLTSGTLKKTTLAIAMVFGMLSVSTAANAESLPPKDWPIIKTNSEVTYSFSNSTRKYKIRTVSVDGFSVNSADKEEFSWVPFCVYCDKDKYGKESGSVYGDLYPLKVGKTVSFQSSRGDVTVNQTILVEKVSTIDLGYGPYKTFVITNNYFNDNGRAKKIYWYSPELGQILKMQYFEYGKPNNGIVTAISSVHNEGHW